MEHTGTIENITSTEVEEGKDEADNDDAEEAPTQTLDVNGEDSSQDSHLESQLDAISPLPPEDPQPSPPPGDRCRPIKKIFQN